MAHATDLVTVALSVGVMPMVGFDRAAGAIFTLDTESGSGDIVTVSGAYRLGEFLVPRGNHPG